MLFLSSVWPQGAKGFSSRCLCGVALFLSTIILRSGAYHFRVFTEVFDKLGSRYPPINTEELVRLHHKAKEMFQFGYDNYMTYAFPMDELDPIHCDGRGPDYENP